MVGVMATDSTAYKGNDVMTTIVSVPGGTTPHPNENSNGNDRLSSGGTLVDPNRSPRAVCVRTVCGPGTLR